MEKDSKNLAVPLSRRWPAIFSNGLLIALLALESWLFICDRFAWCGFENRKGWAVLIATVIASSLLTAFFVWFLACVLVGRRQQFGLGWLLLLMLAVAIPLGWLTSSVQRANRQHTAIAELTGRYHFQYERESAAANLTVTQPPRFLKKVLKREFFDDVATIRLGESQSSTVDARDLTYLRDFKRLRRLEVCLEGGFFDEEESEQPEERDALLRATDAGLATLKKLVLLEDLSLSNCVQLTDIDLENIARLDRLTSLSLTNLPQVTDVGLNQLRGLTRLERLQLDGLTQITDAGLAGIGSLTELRVLSISMPDNKPLGSEAIENLARCVKLETLLLDGTNFTDAGMQYIGNFKRLQNLSLRGADLTDAGMRQLADLKQLKYLALGGTVITDAGVAHLGALTSLKCLDLKDTSISDASVQYLGSLPHLIFLYVSGTNITQDGRAKLRERNPSLLIMSPFAGDDPLSIR